MSPNTYGAARPPAPPPTGARDRRIPRPERTPVDYARVSNGGGKRS